MANKKLLPMLLAGVITLSLTACSGGTTAESPAPTQAAETQAPAPKESVAPSAKKLSVMDAEYEIQMAMQYQLEEMFGEKVVDARIYVEKVYTAEEEQADELLKSYHLGPDEYAFQVKYELKPAEGVDPIEMTAGTGEYDQESGWVVEKYNIGILRPNQGGVPAYVITDFGTGF